MSVRSRSTVLARSSGSVRAGILAALAATQRLTAPVCESPNASSPASGAGERPAGYRPIGLIPVLRAEVACSGAPPESHYAAVGG
jgi:hypothetical protein